MRQDSRNRSRHELPAVFHGSLGSEKRRNGPEAPVFCLDQVNGIERYSSAQAGDAIAAIATSGSDQCPLTGTHVD